MKPVKKFFAFLVDQLKLLAIASIVALICIIFFVAGCITTDPGRLQEIAFQNLVSQGIEDPTPEQIVIETRRLQTMSKDLIMANIESMRVLLVPLLEKAIAEPGYFEEHKTEILSAKALLKNFVFLAGFRGGNIERIIEINDEIDTYFALITGPDDA